MKKHFNRTTILLLTLCAAGCVEDVDHKRVPGMLSVGQDGHTIIETYDLGRKNSLDLTVAKSGLMDRGGTVIFTVDPKLLDSLNNANGTNYLLLPQECYTLEQNSTIAPGADRLLKVGALTYDPHEISKISGFEEQRYVLPLRASSEGIMNVHPLFTDLSLKKRL